MPFEHLAAYALPDLKVNYGPWEVKKPFPWGQIIAQSTPALISAIQSFTPEGRQKDELQKLELQYNQQKLQYLRDHPDIAFGGKSYLDPDVRANLKAHTDLLNRTKSDTGDPGTFHGTVYDPGVKTGVPALPSAMIPTSSTGSLTPPLASAASFDSYSGPTTSPFDYYNGNA